MLPKKKINFIYLLIKQLNQVVTSQHYSNYKLLINLIAEFLNLGKNAVN